MKLTVVFSVLGQHDIARLAIDHAVINASDPNTRIVVIDNGGDFKYEDEKVTVLWPGKNIGVYPVFEYAFKNVEGDVLAFMHSDLIIVEKGYDESILKVFGECGDLGLLGFVGSNEIDHNGGRGGGTTSNFQGKTYHSRDVDPLIQWTGTPAEAHGMRNAGFTAAAVVDGCAMVISRKAWNRIDYREDFAPHHFYDRLISVQMLERGMKVGVLGVACDHLGGQTVSKEQRYPDMAEAWCKRHVPPERFEGHPGNWSWDMTVYRAGEMMFLREYRDKKHLIPIRV